MKMTKEKARLAHYRARELVLEQKLEKAETVEEYTELLNEINGISMHIEAIEAQLSAGFRSKSNEEFTVRSKKFKYESEY